MVEAPKPKRATAAAAATSGAKPKAIRPKAAVSLPAKPKKPTMPYPFTNQKQRTEALVPNQNFQRKDPVMHFLLKNAEERFPVKQVHTSSDWLMTQSERGQEIRDYAAGNCVQWLNPAGRGTIYLFMIDNTISEEDTAKFKAYCEAYFHGVPVKVVRPGSKICETMRNGKRIVKKRVPQDFIAHHKITTRDNGGYFQINATDIIQALKEYRVNDTYCILAVTNTDLYPREEWNFVFGLASPSNQCGVFSFCRHAEMKPGTPAEVAQVKWIQRSCSTMVHEIGHMFGLKHCIYYECTMNGTNGSFESGRVKKKTLCPVCLCKLKLNIKFDCAERYQKMAEVSRALGFESKAAFLEQILSNAAAGN
mmetsp:Transcript_39644/g.51954  ORF Transcript_39644/g.51954 Transcript_39644/m.51954 type:complete len:364 (+) Transcript_39644:43-1134(+)